MGCCSLPLCALRIWSLVGIAHVFVFNVHQLGKHDLRKSHVPGCEVPVLATTPSIHLWQQW